MLDLVVHDLLSKIKDSWYRDSKLAILISNLQLKHDPHHKYSWAKGELRRRGKLMI